MALFGRPADPAGLAYFNAETKGGMDLTAIGDLAGTDEYQDRFTGFSREQIIQSVYQSLFERDATDGEINTWLELWDSQGATVNDIAIRILDGARNEDLATVNAKIAAADLFTARLDLDAEVVAYDGEFAASVGRDYINAVAADDAATPEEADAAILRLFPDGGQNPGNPPAGGGGGGGGGGVADPVFVVTNQAGVVTFSGDATGPITFETANGVTTFSRQGVDAANTVTNVNNTNLSLAAGQELRLSGDQADNQQITGAGTVVISGLDADDDISAVTANGTATLEGSFNLAANVQLSTTIDVNVAAGQTLTLTAAQANNVDIIGGGKTVVNVADGDQTLSILTSGGNSINGGAGSDVIVSGAGADVIDGGDRAMIVSGTPGTRESFSFSIDSPEGWGVLSGGTFSFDTNGAAAGGKIDIAYNAAASFDQSADTDSRLEVGNKVAAGLTAAGFTVARSGTDNSNFTVTHSAVGDATDVTLSVTGGRASSSTPFTTVQGQNATPDTATIIEASADTMTGGAGNDVFIVTASTLGALDRVTDFVGGQDVIDFAGTTNYDFGGIKVGVGATLAAQVASVLGQTDTNDVAQFSFEGKTYFLLDGNGNAAFDAGVDQIVEVTGLSGTVTDASFA